VDRVVFIPIVVRNVSVKISNKHILIHRPNELSIQWAQRIVQHYAADARVFDVNVRSVDIGTSTRLRVDVCHDAVEAVPSQWFVKTPSLAIKPRLITALPRFLHKEIKFYRSLSAHVPLKLPRILAAESLLCQGSTLVMSDLTENNFRPGLVSDALSVDQAGQVIRQLAKLHGHYWNKPNLLQTYRWLNGMSYQIENAMGTMMAYPLMRQGLRLAGGLVSTMLSQPALTYAANRRRYKHFLNSESRTLVHYDCHPGNLFWEGKEPGFLDWQLVRMGEGVGDVAYFLATALEPELRRKHEKTLLSQYVNQLAMAGVPELNEDRIFNRYQMHLTYPFEAMLVTLAIGDMMQKDVNLELIKRATAAVEDHDSFARLIN
jgi:hypothetical protein